MEARRDDGEQTKVRLGEKDKIAGIPSDGDDYRDRFLPQKLPQKLLWALARPEQPITASNCWYGAHFSDTATSRNCPCFLPLGLGFGIANLVAEARYGMTAVHLLCLTGRAMSLQSRSTPNAVFTARMHELGTAPSPVTARITNPLPVRGFPERPDDGIGCTFHKMRKQGDRRKTSY